MPARAEARRAPLAGAGRGGSAPCRRGLSRGRTWLERAGTEARLAGAAVWAGVTA